GRGPACPGWADRSVRLPALAVVLGRVLSQGRARSLEPGVLDARQVLGVEEGDPAAVRRRRQPDGARGRAAAPPAVPVRLHPMVAPPATTAIAFSTTTSVLEASGRIGGRDHVVVGVVTLCRIDSGAKRWLFYVGGGLGLVVDSG
ncbi:unnamed protein product, partial [Laminaria digitata]